MVSLGERRKCVWVEGGLEKVRPAFLLRRFAAAWKDEEATSSRISGLKEVRKEMDERRKRKREKERGSFLLAEVFVPGLSPHLSSMQIFPSEGWFRLYIGPGCAGNMPVSHQC